MTIEKLICEDSYFADGTANPRDIGFQLASPDHLIVEVDGVRQALGSAYLVNGDYLGGGGQIIPFAPWAEGAVVDYFRETPLLQPASLPAGQPLPSRSIEAQLDRSVMRIQEIARDLSRAPLLPRNGGVLGQFAVVLPDGSWGFADGTGTDAALRGDLAQPLPGKGADLSGYSPSVAYGAGTVGRKLKQIVSVGDYQPAGDGETDDFEAFAAAYDAVAWGGSIYVPQVGSEGYYLSANPDAGDKPVHWIFDTAIQFRGPGLGDPDNGAGTFASLYTNPWLRVIGSQRKVAFGTVNSPSGGAIIGDSWEWTADSLAGWPKAITGNLTNGSAVISNVPANLIGALYKGCRITSAVAQWGYDGAATRKLRVLSVDVDNRTVTVGYDANGNWVNTPAPYLGASANGVSFTVHKRQWFAGRYEGLDTGDVDASIAGEVHYEICNPVMNITGAPGAMYEFNLNSYAITEDYCRALFITGGGSAQNGKLVGIDMQRGGTVKWATGISIRNAQVGLYANAKFPIEISATFNNNTTGLPETVGYGVHFDNISAPKGALLEGAQLANGSDALWLKRATDTAPTGRFASFKTANEATDLAYLGVNGEFHASGLHVLDGFDLNLGRAYVAGAIAPAGYITLKAQGVTVRVPALPV